MVLEIIICTISGICVCVAAILFLKSRTSLQKIQYEYIQKQGYLAKSCSEIEETIQKLNKQKLEQIQSLELLRQRGMQDIYDELDTLKQHSDFSLQSYLQQIDLAYCNKEVEFDKKINQLQKEKEQIENELNSIKRTLLAATEAQLREQQKDDNTDFYTVHIQHKDNFEINILKEVEDKLSDPRPIRMLIWTTYYSKNANEMCSRVLGKKEKITGIYKITNINTKQCYIGQAKNMKDRWREHLKCGLGIDTPAGNKLYTAMLKDGLSSFTFELLEECPDAQLNEKEKFYIDLYSSYDYGYNSNRGISK